MTTFDTNTRPAIPSAAASRLVLRIKSILTGMTARSPRDPSDLLEAQARYEAARTSVNRLLC